MVMHDIKLRTEKNAPNLLAISMAMWIRQYGAEQITQYGRSGATLWSDRGGGRHGHPA